MRSSLITFLFTLCLISCSKDVESGDVNGGNGGNIGGNSNGNNSNVTMKITIEGNSFSAVLAENNAAASFRTLLPLTLNMSELNGNEKYTTLNNGLPTQAVNVGRVQSGDLMLFGSSTLVLFYETFSTSYSYTPVARIAAPQRLPIVVGSRDVVVKFELEK